MQTSKSSAPSIFVHRHKSAIRVLFIFRHTLLLLVTLLPEVSEASTHVPIVFNVIRKGTAPVNGHVTQLQMQSVVDDLNLAFSGSGFTFSLHNYYYYQSSLYYSEWDHDTGNGKPDVMCDIALFGSQNHSPAHVVHVYTHGTAQANYGELPWAYAEDDCRHGIAVERIWLPGGESPDPELLIHEMGHYLGLYHTFHTVQGMILGCSEDGIENTTPHPHYTGQCASSGCGGDAPYDNYMNGVPSGCRDTFLSSQLERMKWASSLFRPSLVQVQATLDVSDNNFFIHVRGQPILWPNNITVTAEHSITSGGGLNIYEGLHVVFKAGNVIHLSGQMEIKVGTSFEASIEAGVGAKSSSAAVRVDHEAEGRTHLKEVIVGSQALEVFPNPASDIATWSYHVKEDAEFVSLEVFDLQGRRIATLVNGNDSTGRYLVQWSATDESGRPVANGAYLGVLRIGSVSMSRMITIIR